MTGAIRLYVPRNGTVKISGVTSPGKAATCAYWFLKKNYPCIEFFCIGANANQQAMKAMSIFMDMVESDSNYQGQSVAFQPLHYKTETEEESGNKMEKDCTVWATLLVSRPPKL